MFKKELFDYVLQTTVGNPEVTQEEYSFLDSIYKKTVREIFLLTKDMTDFYTQIYKKEVTEENILDQNKDKILLSFKITNKKDENIFIDNIKKIQKEDGTICNFSNIDEIYSLFLEQRPIFESFYATNNTDIFILEPKDYNFILPKIYYCFITPDLFAIPGTEQNFIFNENKVIYPVTTTYYEKIEETNKEEVFVPPCAQNLLIELMRYYFDEGLPPQEREILRLKIEQEKKEIVRALFVKTTSSVVFKRKSYYKI